MPPRRRLTEAQKRLVGASYDWKCGMCATTLASTYHVDHIVPLWAGGADDPAQCQALCADCHAIKTQEEAIARAARRRGARARTRGRAPLECARCGHMVSAYFLHACAPP